MKQGDLVTRKSYGGDVIFKIQDIKMQQAILRGVELRLMADAPILDLEPTTAEYTQNLSGMRPHWAESMRRNQVVPAMTPGITGKGTSGYFEMPGKVLHLDGDASYLRKCMALYGELRVPVEGYYVPEANMAEALYRLLPQVRPDIVVITGHDGILKHRNGQDISQLSSYKNSHNFVNAVRVARQYEKNRDTLVVVAGACQSHFEALLQAGANFASSPARVLIHALDPLCIAAKLAFTPIQETVNLVDVISLTHSGLEGLGGLETKGSYRRGVPRITYSSTK
ncbi:sporulation peptidase YabG [Paenibacillus sp. GD4]|jgi:spore coat assemly protein|uniref:sporulation peptidase YabG n=1 Tax=Paenibacillus TaxID=44249 RepID=UPI002543BAAE|nr:MULTISPECIES: sporulation peptidase YabG [Paenibacillus]MDQ1910956.1 sporulation peptidase YabG [Paenibacillus sp. GD4]